MNFEEWWNISGGSVVHKDPKEAARDAWQSAYMQACADMTPNGNVRPEYRTFKNIRTGELIYTNLTETVDDFRSLLDPNDYVEIKK